MVREFIPRLSVTLLCLIQWFKLVGECFQQPFPEVILFPYSTYCIPESGISFTSASQGCRTVSAPLCTSVVRQAEMFFPSHWRHKCSRERLHFIQSCGWWFYKCKGALSQMWVTGTALAPAGTGVSWVSLWAAWHQGKRAFPGIHSSLSLDLLCHLLLPPVLSHPCSAASPCAYAAALGNGVGNTAT